MTGIGAIAVAQPCQQLQVFIVVEYVAGLGCQGVDWVALAIKTHPMLGTFLHHIQLYVSTSPPKEKCCASVTA